MGRVLIVAALVVGGCGAPPSPGRGPVDAAPLHDAALAVAPAREETIGALLAGERHAIVRRPSGAVLDDGRPALSLVDGRLVPLPPAGLGALGEGAHIDLDDGQRWFLVEWPDGGDARWVMPAHRREEIAAREATFAAELPRLPPAARAALARRLRLLATVSSAEGDFGGVATHPHDSAGSLGIFQWAAGRRSVVDAGTSLGHFFAAVRGHRRDGDPLAPLAAAAWDQCTAAGLDAREGALRLDGRPATGESVERALAVEMARGGGALRALQLVVALADVEHIAARRVPVGDTSRTVGEVLRSDRALATAVLLGVNRPAWVVPSLAEALERAPEPTRDAVRRGLPLNEKAERALERELRRRALAHYRPYEREARAMRLLTSENGW